MEKLGFRNCSSGQLAVSIVIYGFTIMLGGIGVHVLFAVEDPTLSPFMRYAISLIILAAFCIPCMLLIIDACISFSEKIVVAEEAVVFFRGKTQIRYIPLRQMTAFGCAAFTHRNGYIFFCATPIEEINTFSQRHKRKALDLFGRNRIEQASKSREGCWKLAVGTYIQLERKKNRDNIIILENASYERLNKVSNFLHKEPILTGPIIMDHPKAWYH